MGGFAVALVIVGLIAASGGGKKKSPGTSQSRPGASTRPGTRPGGGRVFKNLPTPGYWYKVQSRDLRPIVVKSSTGSLSGIKIEYPDQSMAWRAYVGVTEQRLDKGSSLSKWAGLNGVLGPRHGVDTAMGLADEIMGAVAAGTGGNWGALAAEGAAIATEVWAGVRDQQDAAMLIVSDFVITFLANIYLAPENQSYRVEDPVFGIGLDLQIGDSIYIPKGGVYYDGSTPGGSKPNRP